jgi:hypothetical protein
MIRRIACAIACVFSVSGCKDTSGPAVAVTLELVSVDGVVVPARLVSPAGKPATVARGFLQGTNWGAACGFAVGLAEGPVTFLDVADCRLKPGEERKFSITFSDTRFPAGTHEYRFIPE